jgi:hypothetical protein
VITLALCQRQQQQAATAKGIIADKGVLLLSSSPSLVLLLSVRVSLICLEGEKARSAVWFFFVLCSMSPMIAWQQARACRRRPAAGLFCYLALCFVLSLCPHDANLSLSLSFLSFSLSSTTNEQQQQQPTTIKQSA